MQDDAIARYRARREQRIALKNERRMDSVLNLDDEDPDWITINGTHVPLDDEGNALSGGKLKGKSFKEAKSEKKTGSKSEKKGSDETHKSVSGETPKTTPTSAKTAFKAKNEAKKDYVLCMSMEEQASYLWDSGYLSYEAAVASTHDGTASKKVEDYFAILEENGDFISMKPLADNPNKTAQDLVNKDVCKNYVEARRHIISGNTGASEEDVTIMADAIHEYTQLNRINADISSGLDMYIEKDHTYDGTIYRGLDLGWDNDYDDFMSQIQVGAVIDNKGKNGSWSSDESVAIDFSNRSDSKGSVILKCVGNRTSAPIASLSAFPHEFEVLSHSKAQWTVINVMKTEREDGSKYAEITVVETGEHKG